MVIIEKTLEHAFSKDERSRHSIIEAVREKVADRLEHGHSFARTTVAEPTQVRYRSGSDKDNASQRQNGVRVRLPERER
jgi:hypothetical protein